MKTIKDIELSFKENALTKMISNLEMINKQIGVMEKIDPNGLNSVSDYLDFQIELDDLKRRRRNLIGNIESERAKK